VSETVRRCTPQHLRHEFLGELKLLATHTVLGSEQPPSHPRFGGMRAVQQPVQVTVARQRLSKIGNADPGRFARDLTERRLRAAGGAEEYRQPDHPFMADRGHLEHDPAVSYRDTRIHRRHGKYTSVIASPG
jgi:hypothetical protein